MKRLIVVAAGSLATLPALAADYSSLTVDMTGIDAAAIGIAGTLLTAMAVFWGLRRILGMVG